jgi:diguanylate cyclase (GGDEF)-like protein/PAS domain S-box-containing protein
MKELEHAAAAIQRGDLSFRLASDARDEFGDLSRGFDAMTAALLENMRLRERSEQSLADLIDAIPAMVGYFDMQERCGYANEAALMLQGLKRGEIVGMTLHAALGDDLHAQHASSVKEVLRGRRARLEGHAPFQGREAHFQAHLVPDFGEDGVQRGFYIMTFDITALKEAEARQASSERRLRAIADNLPVSITYVDSEERFEFVNRTGLDWAGRAASDVLGRRVEDCMPADRYALRRDAIQRALGGERVSLDIDSGVGPQARSLQCVYVPDLQPDGRIVGLYGLETDVSAMKKIERQLSLLVRSDALTGLANRYQFNDQMPRILARARRARAGVALMYLDIDHFKQINDTLGHAAGDAVLQAFAQRLTQSVRTTDTVARLGGDEFVVILEGLHDEAEPQFVARKILANVSRPLEIEGRTLEVTTSIGIAWRADVGACADEAQCAQALLARADEGLYQAKAAGRNTWRLLAEAAPRAVAENAS